MHFLTQILLMIRFFLQSLLLFISSLIAYSQTYPFKHYSTSDGLSHPLVRKVFQDSDGFMWFATEGGVNRFDGNTFLSFHGSDFGGIAVYDIFEYPKGTLWFATYGKGIALLNRNESLMTRKILTSDSLTHTAVTVITKDIEGNVWIGTDSGIRVITKSGMIYQYRKEFDGDPGEIYGIVRDPNGKIWVAAWNGLFLCNWYPSGVLSAKKLLPNPTRSLLLLRNGSIIAGVSGGGNDKYGCVYQFQNGRKSTIISYATDHTLINARSLFEDDKGNIWIGNAYGIYIIQDKRIIHLRSDNGLVHENIYSIFQDREGTMWFGTENGVMKLTQSRFINYGMKHGLTGYNALTIAEDTRKNIWFGMWNGLNCLSPHGRIQTWDETDGLLHHSVFAIEEDPQGKIWIGTLRGLNILSPNNISSALRNERVSALRRTRDGNMWIATVGTLWKMRGTKTLLKLDERNGIPHDYIGQMLIGRDESLWFATSENGLWRYYDGKFSSINDRNGLPGNHVQAICLDRAGALWIGTTKGLSVWRNGKCMQPPFDAPPIKSGNIHLIVMDSSLHMWFGTDAGIFKWDGKELKHYGMRDGLASDIVQSGLADSDGDMWFGTHGGISRLDKIYQTYIIPTPSLYFEGISTAGKEYLATETPDISYNQRSLLVRFNVLSYVDERAVEFEWMLNGHDRGWQGPQHERYIRYLNLEPGSYDLLVRARNRNGNWSGPMRCTFTIEPPFWWTWWFISLIVTMICGILFLAYRYRVRQLLRVERMRSRIAADLHDDIASSLASVALYSDVIERTAYFPDESQQLLRRIRELSREVMENIGAIVWSVDPQQDELVDVLTYLQRHGKQISASVGVTYTSRIPDRMQSLRLSGEQRRTLYLIFKEALNNILKHSRCTKIHFTCDVYENMLEITLQDNGTGFSKDAISSGHGLKNMHSRAETIGATIEITSHFGIGTTVCFRMKMT